MNPPKIAAVIALLANVPVWALTGHPPLYPALWFAAAFAVARYLPAR